MSFLGIGGPSAFNKDIKQTSTTNNTDNSRIVTLTDSLNTQITKNLALTNATSRVYNSAFDAIDSFNSVNSFELQNIGGPPSIPTLDFTGLRSIFTNPADLSKLINANTISADPNVNKNGFDFSGQQGQSFLAGVQGLVKDTWAGLVGATEAAKPVTESATNSNLIKYVLIAGVVLVGLLVLLKIRK